MYAIDRYKNDWYCSIAYTIKQVTTAMLQLLTLNNILKLEFLALTACYLNIPSEYRSSLEYEAPTLPDAIFFRNFVDSCQLEIGYIGFWGSYKALFA